MKALARIRALATAYEPQTKETEMENEKKKITAYLIDVEKQEHRKVVIEDSLGTFYRLLDCRTIDIRPVSVGIEAERIEYDAIIDDEGLFKEGHRISCIDGIGRAVFVGSILVTGRADKEGELTSLSDDDALFIESYVKNVPTIYHPEGNVMLTETYMQ